MVEEKVIQQESVAPVEQSVAATDAPQTPPTPTVDVDAIKAEYEAKIAVEKAAREKAEKSFGELKAKVDDMYKKADEKRLKTLEDQGQYKSLWEEANKTAQSKDSEIGTLKSEIEELVKNDVRLKVIGCREDLDQDIQELILSAEKRTMKNTGLHLTVALNYGGRKEILLAVRAMVRDILKGNLKPDSLSEEKFEQCLETHGIPDPDLLIRTSGEYRLSNFLLWQCAYSEFVILDTLWPDFGKADLMTAIAEFHRRERRYGGTTV